MLQLGSHRVGRHVLKYLNGQRVGNVRLSGTHSGCATRQAVIAAAQQFVQQHPHEALASLGSHSQPRRVAGRWISRNSCPILRSRRTTWDQGICAASNKALCGCTATMHTPCDMYSWPQAGIPQRPAKAFNCSGAQAAVARPFYSLACMPGSRWASSNSASSSVSRPSLSTATSFAALQCTIVWTSFLPTCLRAASVSRGAPALPCQVHSTRTLPALWIFTARRLSAYRP